VNETRHLHELSCILNGETVEDISNKYHFFLLAPGRYNKYPLYLNQDDLFSIV